MLKYTIYYIFGFLGYLLNQFDALNTSEDKNDDDYTKYMNANFRSSGLAANTIARYF